MDVLVYETRAVLNFFLIHFRIRTVAYFLVVKISNIRRKHLEKHMVFDKEKESRDTCLKVLIDVVSIELFVCTFVCIRSNLDAFY